MVLFILVLVGVCMAVLCWASAAANIGVSTDKVIYNSILGAVYTIQLTMIALKDK